MEIEPPINISKMDIDPLRYRPLPTNLPAYGNGKVRYGFIYTTYLLLWKIFVRPIIEDRNDRDILGSCKQNWLNLGKSLITLILPK